MDEQIEGLQKEVYIAFGYTYFQAEVLHRGVACLIALSKFEDPKAMTQLRYEEELTRAFASTLGPAVKQIEGLLLAEEFRVVDAAVGRRNHLAHHFWWERSPDLFSEEGIRGILRDLSAWHAEFARAEQLVAEHLMVMNIDKVGLTEEIIQEGVQAELSGRKMDPLHTQRLPKKNEEIVRVFRDWPGPGAYQLIFEARDKTYWLPGDCGLAWSSFTEPEPGWVQVEEINQFLPSPILSRPACSAPWSYEFNLRKKAKLVFEPVLNPNIHYRWKVVKP